MKALKFHICVLAFWASLLIPSTCNGDSAVKKKYAALYIFGDSLFDPGNNNYINTTTDYKANWSPYGETFFKYPTGRFCDGRLIPDFIGNMLFTHKLWFSHFVEHLVCKAQVSQSLLSR